MSLKMMFVRFLVKQMSKGLFNSDRINVEYLRNKLAKAYAKHTVEKGVSVSLEVFNNVEVAVFIPDKLTSNNIVYYIHGGGLITGDRHTAGPYSSELALETGCKVVSCTYRLAPEHPFPAGFDDSYAVYKYLVDNFRTSKIGIIGESGGAYLTLVTALKIREQNIKKPSSLVMNSIVADMSGYIKRVNSPKETTVTVGGLEQLAAMYAPMGDLKNPYISPILADFNNLPAMRIVYDAGELLAIDSKLVAEKAKKAGIYVEIAEYKGCFHAFTTTGKNTPESSRELKESMRFMVESFEDLLPLK